jgi:isoleucyl-tRNA synthetase
MNCIVSGMVLAADGKKMSKSQRNYTDPMDVINQHGADALRLFLMNSAVMKADDLRFSDEGVKEVLKGVIIPIWNAYSFFVTTRTSTAWNLRARPRRARRIPWTLDPVRLRAHDQGPDRGPGRLRPVQGRAARGRVHRPFEQLVHPPLAQALLASGGDADKEQAYATLWRVLTRLALAAAPLMPFLSEEIWANLRSSDAPESVHLCDWPAYDEAFRDQELEARMAVTLKAVSMGRALRYQHNLKVPSPGRRALVTRSAEERAVLTEMADIPRRSSTSRKWSSARTRRNWSSTRPSPTSASWARSMART